MNDVVPAEPSPHETRFVEGRTIQDLRTRARLPDGYEVGAPQAFDPRIAYELALEMGSPESVFEKYGLTSDQAVGLLRTPAFVAKIHEYRDEIVKGGVSFKLKAKIQAEDLLTQSYDIATDPEAPASVRADLIKWTAAVAGFGPVTQAPKGEGGANAGAGFTLNITFSGGPAAGAPRPAIDVTPTREE